MTSRRRRATSTSIIGVLIALSIVLSSCAPTTNSAVENSEGPTTSQPAPAPSPSGPDKGSTPAINIRQPAGSPSGSEPDLPAWLKDLVQEKTGEYTREKFTDWAKKMSKNSFASDLIGDIGGRIFDVIFGGLFGGGNAQQQTFDQRFQKVREQIADVNQQIGTLDDVLKDGFRKINLLVADTAYQRELAALESSTLTPLKAAIRNMKRTADVAKKNTTDPVTGKNTVSAADMAEARDALKQYQAQLVTLFGASPTGVDSSEVNSQPGRPTRFVAQVQKLMQVLNAKTVEQYPVTSHAISTALQNNWKLLYSRFQQAASLWLSYRASDPGATPTTLGRVKNEYESMNNAMLDLYPWAVPEGTLYDTRTGYWLTSADASLRPAVEGAAWPVTHPKDSIVWVPEPEQVAFINSTGERFGALSATSLHSNLSYQPDWTNRDWTKIASADFPKFVRDYVAMGKAAGSSVTTTGGLLSATSIGADDDGGSALLAQLSDPDGGIYDYAEVGGSEQSCSHTSYLRTVDCHVTSMGETKEVDTFYVKTFNTHVVPNKFEDVNGTSGRTCTATVVWIEVDGKKVQVDSALTEDSKDGKSTYTSRNCMVSQIFLLDNSAAKSMFINNGQDYHFDKTEPDSVTVTVRPRS